MGHHHALERMVKQVVPGTPAHAQIPDARKFLLLATAHTGIRLHQDQLKPIDQLGAELRQCRHQRHRQIGFTRPHLNDGEGPGLIGEGAQPGAELKRQHLPEILPKAWGGDEIPPWPDGG